MIDKQPTRKCMIYCVYARYTSNFSNKCIELLVYAVCLSLVPRWLKAFIGFTYVAKVVYLR
jgi:hypothetical protein